MLEVCDSLLRTGAGELEQRAHRALGPGADDPAAAFQASPLAATNPPAAALQGGFPLAGAGEGFLARFGGAQGFLNYMNAVAQGGAFAVPLGAIGQAPGILEPGQWERIVEQARREGAGGGPAGSRPGIDAPGTGGTRSCAPRNPVFTLSGEVRARIESYCERLRAAVAPIGTASFDSETWNQFWTISLRSAEGVRLARQLLWLLKGLVKHRTGTPGTRVRTNGRIVDLRDASVAPESFADIVEEVPLLGQYIYDRYTAPAQFAIGSPFTSDETWDALRLLARRLRHKQLDCKTAEGLDGDAYAAIRFLVEGIRSRNQRVDLDGVPTDVVHLDLLARGAGREQEPAKANSGVPLVRADFYTTEDLRLARSREAPPALRFAPRPPDAHPGMDPMSVATKAQHEEDRAGGDSLPGEAWRGGSEATPEIRAAGLRWSGGLMPPLRMAGMEFQEEGTRALAGQAVQLAGTARIVREQIAREEASIARSAYEAAPSFTLSVALRYEDPQAAPKARAAPAAQNPAPSKPSCSCNGPQSGPSG